MFIPVWSTTGLLWLFSFLGFLRIATCPSCWVIMWPPARDIKQPSDVTPSQTVSLCSLLECDLFSTLCHSTAPGSSSMCCLPSLALTQLLSSDPLSAPVWHADKEERQKPSHSVRRKTRLFPFFQNTFWLACPVHTQRLTSYIIYTTTSVCFLSLEQGWLYIV